MYFCKKKIQIINIKENIQKAIIDIIKPKQYLHFFSISSKNRKNFIVKKIFDEISI